jgi:hypothetical protein
MSTLSFSDLIVRNGTSLEIDETQSLNYEGEVGEVNS